MWNPFFQLFWQNWKNCPYPVYLGSNTVRFQDDRIITVLSGEDKDWSRSFKSILQQIPHPYLLVWLEDFFITSPVNSQNIARYVQFMQEHKARHIQPKCQPVPDDWICEDIGIYGKGRPYRANVVGFWERNYLLDLLLEGESPWNFEILGSYRTAYDDGFYCLHPAPFSWINVVEKGSWVPKHFTYCQQHGIEIDLSKRHVLKGGKKWQSVLQMLYFDSVIKIPWKLRLKLMNVLRKLIITY
ncbi:MAG: hypothetical protein DRR00_17840 [Candidatus Parabeggiatoa sp. nov. 3]|nr:MAG: hypothetical protein DRR00_17840 [Gammaproteobacteria bacterium]